MKFKAIFGLLFALACGTAAHASTCATLSSGASASTIQTDLNSCGSGNTLAFNAGTYALGGTQLTLPCGVSMVGPAVTNLSNGIQTPQQTAFFTGTRGNATGGIATTAGCTPFQSIMFIDWNGGRPNPGGQFLYVTPGTTHLNVEFNNIHGNNCGAYCGSTNANLIFLAYSSGQTTSNINILWNTFAVAGDCGSGAIIESQNSDTEGGGGYCNGVGMGGNLANITVQNNKFLTGDNEMKYYEASSYGFGECNNCNFSYNDFQQFDRIGMEFQANIGGSGSPTLMYNQYNSFHNLLNPHQQDFDISDANGCANSSNCVTHMDYNMTVADTPAVGCGDVGYEIWGGPGTTGNGNFWSGQYMCHTIIYAPTGQFTFNNNTAYTGGSANCGINNLTSEDAPGNSPSCSGNINTSSTSGTIVSVAPVLSQSAGTITITNSNVSAQNGSNGGAFPAVGRDANTTFWCTSDGSTPVAGGSVVFSGNTSIPYWTGAASATVATVTPGGAGTFKCLGMWGAPNQPFSYDAGYGYTPSAVVSIAYSGTQTATPLMSPMSENFSGTVAVTITDASPSPTIHYTTDGSTPTTGSTTYTVPVVASSTETIKAIATSSGLSTSSVGSNTYTFVAAPLLTSCYQSNVGYQGATSWVNTIQADTTVQQQVYCTYASTGQNLLCSPSADANGSQVAVWSETGTDLSISTSGLITGLLAGNNGISNVTAQQGSLTPITCSQWDWTVTSVGTVATPVLVPGTETFYPSTTVTITEGTSGATVYYTLDGSTPTTASSVYSSPISVTSTETIKAVGILADYSNSSIVSQTYTLTPTPLTSCSQQPTGSVTSIAAGSTVQDVVKCFYAPSTILTCSPSADANGSVVTAWSETGSDISIGAIGSGSDGLITGLTVGSNGVAGATVTQVGSAPMACSTYNMGVTVTGTVATPTATPGTESFYPNVVVTLADSTAGATIYYTLNGSSPTTASAVYTTPLTITATTTVKILAVLANYTNSSVATYTYTYNPPALTSCSQTNVGSLTSIGIAGTVQDQVQCFYSSTSQTLPCSGTADANGSIVTAWTNTGADISISSSGLITGLATGTSSASNASVEQNGGSPLACTPYNWTVTALGTVATPSISPSSEAFFPSVNVTITDSTGGATIHYTTDGSTPTISSPVYSAPIAVSTTQTVKAIGTESNYTASATAANTYIYTPSSAPALTGCYQGNSTQFDNILDVGGAAQQVTYCQYASTGQTQPCSPGADTNGSIVTSWSSLGTDISVGAIGSGQPGLVTGLSVGTNGISQAQVRQNGGNVFQCTNWNWNVITGAPAIGAVQTPTLQGNYTYSGTDFFPFGNLGFTSTPPQCPAGTVMNGLTSTLAPNCIQTGTVASCLDVPAWDAGTSYGTGNFTCYQNILYTAEQNSTNQIPSVLDSDYWILTFDPAGAVVGGQFFGTGGATNEGAAAPAFFGGSGNTFDFGQQRLDDIYSWGADNNGTSNNLWSIFVLGNTGATHPRNFTVNWQANGFGADEWRQAVDNFLCWTSGDSNAACGTGLSLDADGLTVDVGVSKGDRTGTIGAGNTKFTSINGIPQADQFAGADPSIQIRAAEAYAILHNIGLVDATHFSGILPCSVDMFGALNSTAAAPVNLVVNLPAAHFQCTVQQTITNSAFTINGVGSLQTQIEYTNPIPASAVLWLHAQIPSGVTNGLTGVHVTDIFFYGDNANVTDAVLAQDVNRSEFRNINTWGATAVGFHCEGCVSDTFYRLRESQPDALAINAGVNAINTFPTYGLELDNSPASGNQTTAGTVTDNAAEGVTGIGWWLKSAASMTFTSGTSEENLRGILINPLCKWNTFTGPDLEANKYNLQGVDITDLGQSNTYIGVLSYSICSACNAVFANGGAVSYLIEDTGLNTGWSGQFNVLGNATYFAGSESLTSMWSAVVDGSIQVGQAVLTPIVISTSGAVGLVPGTGITSATCVDFNSSGLSCTSSRGTFKIVNSSATTTTSFVEVTFHSVLPGVPVCHVTQQGGANWLGLEVSAVNSADFFIANNNTLSGTTTFYITYNCEI